MKPEISKIIILGLPARRWCRDHGDRHVCRLKILEL